MAIAEKCGTPGPMGNIAPRVVIFHVAHHTVDDVFLSYEHFGSEEGALKAIENRYQNEFPNDKLTVVKYLRA